jgi:hypothetical protein
MAYAGIKNYFFRGAPTAIAQSCPGWPCGGFIPGAVTAGVEEGTVVIGVAEGEAMEGAEVITGAVDMPAGEEGDAGTAGAELRGAPTLMSQRCPGWP